MKKFSFSLQAVLDINISLEKEQKNRLAAINHCINALQAERADVCAQMEGCISSYLELLKDSLSIDKISLHNNYLSLLSKEIQDLDIQINEQTVKKQRVQELLLETLKKRKAIERLKDKQYDIYLKEMEALEEKKIDDFASYMYTKA